MTADPARVVDEVLADLAVPGRLGVVVDSPPGAGKSTLVVRAAADLAAAGESVMVVAQTNEQVDDLIDRLATVAPAVRIGRLSAAQYAPSRRVTGHPNVGVANRVADLAGRAVVIGTAAKWAHVTEGTWPWAIVDEAYQMRSDMLLRIADRFERALFVGDPGQLDPFSTIEIDRWTGLTWDPTQSAVAVLLRHNPDLPVHRLPVSWRLPAAAAPVVAEAFYPFDRLPVRHPAGRAAPGVRHRGVPWRPGRRGDRNGRGHRLGAATNYPPGTPCAPTRRPRRPAPMLAMRLLQRGAVAYSEREPEGAPVTAAANRDRRRAPRPGRRDPIACYRPVAGGHRRHRQPVAGPGVRRDASSCTRCPAGATRPQFHLEAGRLCVLTSRHRHACIVVARAGIPELLDAHPSSEPVHLNVPAKFPDGWEANHAVLAHLAHHRVPA